MVQPPFNPLQLPVQAVGWMNEFSPAASVQHLELMDLGSADSGSLGDDVEKSCRCRGLVWLLYQTDILMGTDWRGKNFHPRDQILTCKISVRYP